MLGGGAPQTDQQRIDICHIPKAGGAHRRRAMRSLSTKMKAIIAPGSIGRQNAHLSQDKQRTAQPKEQHKALHVVIAPQSIHLFLHECSVDDMASIPAYA
jgi:hypothetical protein